MGDIDTDTKASSVQLRDTQGRLMKGHARIPGSGRPPGKKNWSVRALAEQTGINPFLISLQILKTQRLPALASDRNNKGRQVTPGEYIKVLTEIQSYLGAKISSTQITGENSGPIRVATLDMTQLLADPQLAAAAQALSLAATEQGRLNPAPDPDERGEE